MKIISNAIRTHTKTQEQMKKCWLTKKEARNNELFFIIYMLR
jgi:hypothetical protein